MEQERRAPPMKQRRSALKFLKALAIQADVFYRDLSSDRVLMEKSQSDHRDLKRYNASWRIL